MTEEHPVVTVTASGIGEFTYCPKQWALSREYGKLSRWDLETRIEALTSSGRQQSPEFELFQRMIQSTVRLDAGTAAHSSLAGQVRTGTMAGQMSRWLAAAAVALAALALYLLLSG